MGSIPRSVTLAFSTAKLLQQIVVVLWQAHRKVLRTLIEESEMGKRAIGYKQPPPEFQFRPGKSGNPSGRPKKLPSLRQVLGDELAKRVRITEDGLEFMASKQVALIKNMVDAALSGNQRAASTVLAFFEKDRGDDPHTADELDDSLLEEFIEREVQLRLKARGSPEDSK